MGQPFRTASTRVDREPAGRIQRQRIMGLRGCLIAAGAGLVFIATSCGSLSTASTIDSTSGDNTSLATTVVEPTTAAASEPATTADTVTTTSSIATSSVGQTVPLTEVVGARAVSEALASARIRWSDASIPSYRLIIAEDRSVWSAGCVWNIAVSNDVVTESEGVQSWAPHMGSCDRREWTVDQLHEVISSWLEDLDKFSAPEFGDHTLVVQFSKIGVPVAMRYDLANGDDEEASMRVTFTATE